MAKMVGQYQAYCDPQSAGQDYSPSDTLSELTGEIILGLVYPVAVSMRLHILHQKKAVMLRQNSAEWIVYLPGIPV
ncbi:hypothetical protein MJO10_28950, partial [Salmonella enterica subsp. enterica serovar Anatum]|nr:hypothetical protein [Salmonella enterica subsp. enterica serovar Anatum]